MSSLQTNGRETFTPTATSTPPAIRRLPSAVIAQIKSSVLINHLNDVVFELVKNALDANARSVAITINFQKGGCTVEDDGTGIPVTEFKEGGGLAKRHYTSRFHSSSSSQACYGEKGEFLASLAALSLLIITSHHRFETLTNTIGFHHSQLITRRLPAPVQHELSSPRHGTKVTVTDLFGNLPVRVKQRALSHQRRGDLDREWDDLRHRLTALLLSWHRPVNVHLTDLSSSKPSRKFNIRPGGKSAGSSSASTSGSQDDVDPDSAVAGPLCDSSYIDRDFVITLLSQAGYVSAANADSWVSISGRTSTISIRALICLEPSPTKLVQFISFGIRPLLAQNEDNALYQEINRLFSLSSFGSVDVEARKDGFDSPDGKRLAVKGINRWPMFFCRIDLGDAAKTRYTTNDDGNDGVQDQNTLQSVLDVLEALVLQFLKHHLFLPRSYKAKRDQPDTGPPEISRQRQSRTHTSAPAHDVSQHDDRAEKNTTVTGEFSVRIPEFRNMSDVPRPATSADFSSWTRVKSGNKFGANEVVGERPVKCKSDLQSKYSTSLNASIDDPVFKGRPASAPTTSKRIQRAQCSSVKKGDEHILDRPDEEILQWTDPISKKAVLVSSRTGQTISSSTTASVFTKPSNSASQLSCSHCTHTDDEAPGTKPSTPWLDDFLENWQNPVFKQPAKPLMSVAPSEGTRTLESGAFLSNAALAEAPWSVSPATNSKLTKRQLQNAQLIAQVDNKFLLIRIWITANDQKKQAIGKSKALFVLVDQHAADERCRVEDLFEQLCTSTSPSLVAQLSKPISFQVSLSEAQLFRRSDDYFKSWGCEYAVVGNSTISSVVIKALPALVAERCRQEPKLAINMLRGEIWSRVDQGQDPSSFQRRPSMPSSQRAQGGDEREGGGVRQQKPADSESDFAATFYKHYTWPRLISQCPKGIIDMLNSRACRSAIMFNDVLGRDECEGLLARLARCSFPFQCAHGRPSLVPIVSLDDALNDGGSHSLRLSSWHNDDGNENDRISIPVVSGGGTIRESIRFDDVLGEARDEYDDQKTSFFDAYKTFR